MYKNESIKFWEYYSLNSNLSIRYAIGLAFALIGLFCILDLYLAPHSKDTIWFIRFGILMPWCTIVFLSTYSRYFIRFGQPILFITSLVVSGGIVAMIYFSKEEDMAYRLYYCGLILGISWTHSILRLRSKLALLSTIITIVEYNCVAIFIQRSLTHDIGVAILINNNFFLVGAGIIGAWASNVTEKMFKKDFENQLLITNEKERLQQAQKELLEQDAMKSKLISIISHDIRGPVSSFKGILNLFYLNGITIDEMKAFSIKLNDSLDEVLNLLTSMLSWSVMHLSNSTLQKTSIDPSKLTDEVFSLMRFKALEKKNKLVNKCKGTNTTVMAEESMLRLVINNLVSNAIKYTEAGVIEVSVEEFEKEIEISVKDNGQGMPQHIVENLFNWKSRISQPGTRSEKGTGIGLLVCKEFVEKHDGILYFRTVWHEGTTFIINLPKDEKSKPNGKRYAKSKLGMNEHLV